MKNLSCIAASLMLATFQQTCCMEDESLKTEQTLVRVPSYDAGRDATLAEKLVGQNPYEYTLENYGKPYRHWRQDREIRPGSGPVDKQNWERFGTTITSLSVAQKFLAVNQAGNYRYSEESLAPSIALVQAENKRIYQEDLEKVKKDIDAYETHKQLMATAYARYCQEETDACKQAQRNLDRAKASLLAFEKKYPSDSTHLPFPHADKKSLNKSNIRGLLGSILKEQRDSSLADQAQQSEYPTLKQAQALTTLKRK